MATALLAVIYAAFIALGIPDSLFGAAWPAIYPDLGIAVSLGSFYSVVSSLFTMISSLLSGRIIARFGTAKVTAVSTALTAAGLLAFSFGGDLWVLCLCAIPLGFGAGAVDTALNNYVALHYNATHMSFLHCFYGVGVAISPYLLSFALAQANDWRGGYRLMFCIQSAITLLLVLTLPLWKKAAQRRAEDTPQMQAVPLKQIMRIPMARATALVFFGSCALESLCLGWGSTWLVTNRGLDPAGAAELITWYFVGMTLGRFLSGVLARWMPPKQIILAGEILTALAVAALFVPAPMAAAAALFAIGLGNGPVFPNMSHLTPIHFGEAVSQSFMGVELASAYGAFMVTPLLFSLIAEIVGVELFPVACAATFILTAAATARMAHHAKKGGNHD